MATIVKQFDRTVCRVIGDEIFAAMQAIASKHGLTVDRKGGRFDANEFTPKYTFGIIGDAADDTGITQAARAKWDQYAVMFGLQKDWLGKSFGSRTKTMTVVGINPRAPANCVMLRDQNNKGFKAPADYIKRQLGA